MVAKKKTDEEGCLIASRVVPIDDLIAARVEQAQAEAQQACEAIMSKLEECASPKIIAELLIQVQGLHLMIDQLGKAHRRQRT